MANLRKRVAACDLERKRVTHSNDARTNEPNDDLNDDRPLLSKVRCIHMNARE